jgi:hypothetical protein
MLHIPNTFSYYGLKNDMQCLFFQGANWHAWVLSSGFQLGMGKINHIQHIVGCGVQKERKEVWIQVESVIDSKSCHIASNALTVT